MAHVTEAELLQHVPNELYINGEWVPAADGRTLTVHDPATGKVIKTIADAGVADGLAALDAAVAAQDAWAATPPRARAEVLRRSFELLQERKHEFALLMTLEMGNRSPRPSVRSPMAANSCAGSVRKPCASPAGTAPTPKAPGA